MVDQVIHLVLQFSRGALMAKCNVKSAYRNVPVHPSDHYLLGTKWRNQYYVDLALPFDLHSAPCFLNLIPDTVEWILVHSYHIPALLYYLDNLITNALPAPLSGLETLLAQLEYCASSLQTARPASPSGEVPRPCNSACSIGV